MHNMTTFATLTGFSIASKFPPDARVSYAALSESTGINESTLKSLIRNAMTMHIFEEPEKGIIGHTCISKLIADPNVHNWLAFGCEEAWPAATKVLLPSYLTLR